MFQPEMAPNVHFVYIKVLRFFFCWLCVTVLQKRGHAYQGGYFMGTTSDLPPIPAVSDWRECSSKCFDRIGCNYWQYNKVEYYCYLFTDFKNIAHFTDDYVIGSKDCPGDEKVAQSSYGECVSNIKSRCEIFGFCLLLFCQNKRTYLCSVCILFGKSVFIFQFLNDKTYN